MVPQKPAKQPSLITSLAYAVASWISFQHNATITPLPCLSLVASLACSLGGYGARENEVEATFKSLLRLLISYYLDHAPTNAVEHEAVDSCSACTGRDLN